VESQKNVGFAVPSYPSCVDQNAAPTERWKFALDLERLEFTGVGRNRSERRPQPGRSPVRVPQILELNT
jgi:hypothetical protein